jgi:hypothetical protein
MIGDRSNNNNRATTTTTVLLFEVASRVFRPRQAAFIILSLLSDCVVGVSCLWLTSTADLIVMPIPLYDTDLIVMPIAPKRHHLERTT